MEIAGSAEQAADIAVARLRPERSERNEGVSVPAVFRVALFSDVSLVPNVFCSGPFYFVGSRIASMRCSTVMCKMTSQYLPRT